MMSINQYIVTSTPVIGKKDKQKARVKVRERERERESKIDR